jgi:hypothetical protein
VRCGRSEGKVRVKIFITQRRRGRREGEREGNDEDDFVTRRGENGRFGKFDFLDRMNRINRILKNPVHPVILSKNFVLALPLAWTSGLPEFPKI